MENNFTSLPYLSEINNRFLKGFVLEDGKTYGRFVNAPLEPETEYKAYLRAATDVNGVRKGFLERRGSESSSIEPVTKRRNENHSNRVSAQLKNRADSLTVIFQELK